jgi:lipid-A-disaccharide synthase-like uncharacterized protein
MESRIQNLENEMRQEHLIILNDQKEKGHEDGIRNTPVIEETDLTPHEMVVRSKYQELISRIFKKGRPALDNYHDKEYLPLVKKIHEWNSEKEQKETENLNEQHQKASDDMQSNYFDNRQDNHNDEALRNLKKELHEAKIDFTQKAEKLGRKTSDISLKPYWAYILLIVGLGVAEIPLNNQVFTSFRETPMLTMIMSMVMVIAIPFLSHAAGKFIKQVKEHKQAYFLVPVIIVGITTLSYFTSDLRVKYLATKGVSTAELQTDFWVFFIMGLMLFLVGVLASYKAHDSSIDFPEILKNYGKLNKDVKEKQALIDQKDKDLTLKYQQDKTNEQARFNSELLSIQSRGEDLYKQKQMVAGNHDQILNNYRGLELIVEQCFNQTIHTYRDNNWRSRSNHAQPKYWSYKLTPLVKEFNQLKELCPNEIEAYV